MNNSMKHAAALDTEDDTARIDTRPNRPTITRFHLYTDAGRYVHFDSEAELGTSLRRGLPSVRNTMTDALSHVLVALDVDGEPIDVVLVNPERQCQNVETLDRAITALTAARDGLLS